MFPEIVLGVEDWVTDLRMGAKAFFSPALAKVGYQLCTVWLHVTVAGP